MPAEEAEIPFECENEEEVAVEEGEGIYPMARLDASEWLLRPRTALGGGRTQSG